MEISHQEFRQFADYIRANYGIHFKSEKKALIEGRLNQVFSTLNIKSLSEYMEYVQADKSGQAAVQMLNRITTNYTFFLREAAHFEFMKTTVLPYLKANVKNKDLRIWSAACSTGEEPYTIAMLLDEYFGLEKKEWDTKLLATDISQGALEIAKAGIYETARLSDLPESWRKKYFKPLDDKRSIVAENIRNEVVFGALNLHAKPLPLRQKLHVIFCRNVMIYFDNATKTLLAERLYDLTEQGGYLFIGHSEGLNRETTRYKYIKPSVYRKE